MLEVPLVMGEKSIERPVKNTAYKRSDEASEAEVVLKETTAVAPGVISG